MKNTSSKDYNTLEYFIYWPRSSLRKVYLFNKDFYKTSRFWSILENYIYIYIPFRPLITLYMVPYVYLNSTYTLQLT